VKSAGFWGGVGAFGPGNRANATVGRAVRLAMLHVAGAKPGFGDAATHGQPAKYTFCAAENVEESPWESYPRSRGVDAASTVTVHCGEGPHNVHDAEAAGDPGLILDKIASAMTSLGQNNAPISQAEYFIVLGPEHAASIARAGLARKDVQSYLFDRARMPAAVFRRHFQELAWTQWMKTVADDRRARQHPSCGLRWTWQALVGDPVVGDDPQRDASYRRLRGLGGPSDDSRISARLGAGSGDFRAGRVARVARR
jgi:hypothetical protein